MSRVPKDTLVERAFLSDEDIAEGWTQAGLLSDAALTLEHQHDDSWNALRAIAAHFGKAGLLKLLATPNAGGRFPDIHWGAVALARERLAYASPLLDLAFAMQGLGSYPITLGGTAAQQAQWVGPVVRGDHVAAFALTEKQAGSDVSQIETTARQDGGDYILNGQKIYISNAGVAELYTVFAATKPKGEKRRLTAFIVPASTPGLRIVRTQVLGSHPIGEVHFDNARVPIAQRIGEEGQGMSLALGTLHRFRPTVGGAALGMGQRALDEAVAHVTSRVQFGKPLASLQAVRMSIADSECDLTAARLLVYRAMAKADAKAGRAAEAHASSIAKLSATEAAFRVIDRAVQLHGGLGVVLDSKVAQLYQDVRALRIYEGASDIQRILIARHVLEG